jgi:hypothetical protein
VNAVDLAGPGTASCAIAREVSATYCSPAMFNHSARSYAWAARLAAHRDIAFDPELLYVSAMLHDIALMPAFDNHAIPFEDAGGHVAWVFTAGLGWPVERRVRAADVIVRHMWDSVDPAFDPEGHLLAAGTSVDISGRGLATIDEAVRADVLAAWPRLGLAAEFTACFRDQSRRKPDSSAGAAIRAGLADRIAANPLDVYPT